MTGRDGLTLRAARASEAAAVRDLARAAYAPYTARIGRRPAPMDEDYAALIAAGHVQVIADGGETRAMMVLWSEGDRLHLDTLAVAPRHQGMGLGRRMIAAAEAQARAAGLGLLALYTNAAMTENIALYRRLGFEEVRRAQDRGYERVFLVKRLDATG